MPISEETKERWAAEERRYTNMQAKKEKKLDAAARKERENQERRRIKAQQQRDAAAKAKDDKPLPPPVVKPTDIRREMLSRMGLTIDNPIEIRRAWKRLALLYHPDKCGGQDKMFKRILEAYEFLTS